MGMDSLDVWIEEFKKLPYDMLGTTAPALVTAYIQQRSKNLSLSSVKFSPEVQFVWMGQIFLNAIAPICVTPTLLTQIPAAQFAAAFSESVAASVNLIIMPAATFSPPNGTNGIVGQVVAIIDPASILHGSNLIYNKLASASYTDTTVFPTAFYNGFNALTATVLGIDTTPTPSGPIPISFTSIPVQ